MATFRGLLSSSLFMLNTVFWCLLILPFALLKACIPIPKFRKTCTQVIIEIANLWVFCNHWNIKFLQSQTKWDLRLQTALNLEKSYLICVNHQSWTDILALQFLLQDKIPFIRFFLKQELIYVPFLGLAWWALDYPFMKRHSKEFLEKHPERREEDLLTTRKATQAFKGSPVSILNFLEGTRFTREKQLAQNSPFRHLLQPKTGGFAFVLGTMGDQFDSILDVTVVYPGGAVSFWQAFCGQMCKVILDVRPVPIPSSFLNGNYLQDLQFRSEIQAWVLELWQKKDALIERILTEHIE